MRKLKPYITTTERRYLLSIDMFRLFNFSFGCVFFANVWVLWKAQRAVRWLFTWVRFTESDTLIDTRKMPTKTNRSNNYTHQTILTTQSMNFCFFFTFCLILVVSNDWLDRWINLVFCRLLTSAQKHTLCAKRNHSTNLWFSQWFAHNPHRFGAFSYFHTLNECTAAVYISFNCVGEKAIFRPYFISFRMVCWYFLYRI